MLLLHLFHQSQQAILPLFALLAGVQGIEGISSMLKGQSDLDRLHKQKFPLESETPAMAASRQRAEELAKGGFSSAEKSAYEQKLNRAENTGYTRSLDVAPGLSQAVLAGTNYANTGAINDFAARDSQLHRDNIHYADRFSQQLQSIADRNIQAQQQNRLRAEQALGQGVAASRDRAFGAGSTLIAAKGYDQQENLMKLISGLGGSKPYTGSSAPLNPNAIPGRSTQPYIPPTPTDYSNPYGAPRDNSQSQVPFNDSFFDYSQLAGMPRT